MVAFRLLLVLQFVVLTAYTVYVGINDGWNFFPAYFGDLLAFHWPGQFDADFTVFLSLTALWTAWRGHFAPRALARGLLPMLFGTAFITTYLFYLSYRERGDVVRMLVGDRVGSAR